METIHGLGALTLGTAGLSVLHVGHRELGPPRNWHPHSEHIHRCARFMFLF